MRSMLCQSSPYFDRGRAIGPGFGIVQPEGQIGMVAEISDGCTHSFLDLRDLRGRWSIRVDPGNNAGSAKSMTSAFSSTTW
jgi:hypothetical protein